MVLTGRTKQATELSVAPCKGRVTARTNLVGLQKSSAAKEKRILAMLAHVQVSGPRGPWGIVLAHAQASEP